MERTEYLLQFGRRLKALRAQRNLTQEALAARCGLDPTFISALEAGRREPRLSNLAKLSQGLGVSVGDLVPDGEIDM
jgi:transcriptional regulator with XRE-family HTH domain